MTEETSLETLLEGVDTGKTSVLDICKNFNKHDPPATITDEQFNNHPFFTKYFSAELCKILEQWYSDGTLDENQHELFQVCSQSLLKLTKGEPSSKQWLNQQTELINLTINCANEIASYGYYIEIGGVEDPSLKSFDYLIQSFQNVQCQQLLDVVAKCVTSRFYIDAFYCLNHINSTSLSDTQHFLLVTCPTYILACDINKTYPLKIVNRMLPLYDEIFKELLPYIKQWTQPIILCLIYPIEFILACIRSLAYEQKKLIFKVIITILLSETTIDTNIEKAQESLIYTSICLLIEIMRSDKDLANKLKNESDQKTEIIDVLNKLSKDGTNDKIKLKALALLSLLIPEEEFQKESKTEQVTEVFIKNLNEAVHQGAHKEIDEVLSGLKDLVQSDDVKQQIVDQNGLPAIIKYAKETKDNPLPLEITYAMTFNADAKKVINQDKEFVDHIKVLRESERRDVSKMAHGIVWKLEGEENFKNKEATKKEQKEKKAAENKSEGNKSEENKSEENSDESTKYDMMISYCWAQKELCHKINDRLEKDGFQVWLDRDEMHGSIIESMAAAIEQARFVLLCMSSNYKNSINCKAEAEYAFNRKSKIVPLIVEPKYRADGWLGFMAGSKIYVDFTEKDEEEEFEATYKSLIAELERNGLRDTEEGKEKKTTPPPATETKPEEHEKEHEHEPPSIQTKEYLTVGPASVWNEEHVKEFLIDNKLEHLMPVCQSMDGETLIEFHQACQATPDTIYKVVNNSKDEHPVSVANLFKFITKLKKYLPPKPPRKIYFQYNFIYPSSTPTTEDVK